MSDEDIRIVVGFFCIVSALIFIEAQYELCVAVPSAWFTGLVSGAVFAVCLWTRYYKRE